MVVGIKQSGPQVEKQGGRKEKAAPTQTLVGTPVTTAEATETVTETQESTGSHETTILVEEVIEMKPEKNAWRGGRRDKQIGSGIMGMKMRG